MSALARWVRAVPPCMGMHSPTPLAQAIAPVLAAELAQFWPFLVVIAALILAWGEARFHLAGLREWKREAQVKIDGLERQAQESRGRADLQGQQINHILQLLGEMRADVKTLLQRNVA